MERGGIRGGETLRHPRYGVSLGTLAGLLLNGMSLMTPHYAFYDITVAYIPYDFNVL